MSKNSVRLLWLMVLPLLLLLSCSTISNITDRAGEVRETAMILATGAQEGRDLIATGQSAISTLEDSAAAQTLQALATERGPAIQATVEAFATEQGPAVRDTAIAFATQQGPALRETAVAFATQEGPGLRETLSSMATNEIPGLAGTVEAAATQLAAGGGERPADIPIPEDAEDNLISAQNLVSFTTALSQQEVQDFYALELPANGWTLVEEDTVTLGSASIYHYVKGERGARLTISPVPGGTGTAVIILIEGQ